MSEVVSLSHSTTGPEHGPACRRFTILDGMVLIVAASVWLLGLRATSRSVAETWERLHQQGLTPISRPDMWVVHIYGLVVAGVGILTVTFLVIRVRQPRPALRQLIWQPGMMACTIISTLIPMLAVVTGRRSAPVFWLLMSASVASAWLAAWSFGRLRPEPGWIDRLGRVIGICWIVFAGYPLFLLIQG
ncbi:MAG: hypothetical protein P4L84_37025 [Isosphaeraceae bacterium]|nr:hypothetical protein [Isosphaeraceae bacterium]